MLAYEFSWSFLTRREFLAMIVDGALLTFALAAVSGLLSLALGLALAVARMSLAFWIRLPAAAMVDIVRNIPALFWILFFYFVLPELLPEPIKLALHAWPAYAFVAGVMGLAVDNGAYLSDIVRNGMVKVPKGERDAAAGFGMSFRQECIHLLCPQSLRAMQLAIANRMVHNFKNTSLCAAIALTELTWATQQIESITFRGLEVTAVATVIYAIGSLSLAFASSRLYRGGRTSDTASDIGARSDVAG